MVSRDISNFEKWIRSVALFSAEGMIDRNSSSLTKFSDGQESRINITNSEKQIFSVIRAILNNTKIYLIDEATSNMSQE